MKEIRRNRVCPNCDKRFVGCKSIRTLASDGSTVHKTVTKAGAFSFGFASVAESSTGGGGERKN